MDKYADHTDKKENKIILICKEKIRWDRVQSHYMRKGFLIYEEMRKYVEEAVSGSHI
jgi:hypothetical protein